MNLSEVSYQFIVAESEMRDVFNRPFADWRRYERARKLFSELYAVAHERFRLAYERYNHEVKEFEYTFNMVPIRVS